MTNYQYAKLDLKEIAMQVKKDKPTDKPYQRMIINDSVNWVSDNHSLTDYQNELLHNYACKLQP